MSNLALIFAVLSLSISILGGIPNAFSSTPGAGTSESIDNIDNYTSADTSNNTANIDNYTSVGFTISSQDTFSDKASYATDYFVMVNNTELLCPSNDCTFELQDGEFRESMIDYSYILDGTLKVTVPFSDGSSITHNYDVYGTLDRVSSKQQDGVTVEENIQGEINIDPTQASMNLDPQYKMYSWGLVNPVDSFVSMLGIKTEQ
jgi:hypothetical protein